MSIFVFWATNGKIEFITMAKRKAVDQYIDKIGTIFAKLPKLSYKSQRAIVDVMPFLVLIFGTLGIALTLVALGIFTIFEPIAQVTGVKGTSSNFFFVLLSLISSILLLSSFTHLQKRRALGWERVYFSRVIALVSNIITLSLEGIILSLIGFFILYQIREHYTK